MNQRINPIFEKLIIDLLVDMPNDIVNKKYFIFHFYLYF